MWDWANNTCTAFLLRNRDKCLKPMVRSQVWSTVWDPHTKEGEHGQSRISTEESRHRLELVGELQKIRAKATMTLLYPLIISIERFTHWIASPIQPNRSSHEGTPNKYRIPFFHILLSTKEWGFFPTPICIYIGINCH